MGYQDDVKESATEIYNESVWGRPPTWDVWRDTPSLRSVLHEVTEWMEYSDLAELHGKTESQVNLDVANVLRPMLLEAQEIEKAVHALGFENHGTGGGHMAYRFEVEGTDTAEGPNHFLLTDEEAHLPMLWDGDATLGYYTDHEDYDPDFLFGTMREVYAKLLDGSALPQWQKPKDGDQADPSQYDPSDVQTINRHRQSIGGDPIDLKAGWTVEEVREMAKNIRAKGRTHNNPDRAELKRKLMR